MPIDPYAALRALLRAEASRSAPGDTPADSAERTAPEHRSKENRQDDKEK
ncbi:hypothetical protein ACQB60_42220 [Actinomycetota bacterium Odt1-20B]